MDNKSTIKLISDKDIALKAMRIFGMEEVKPELPATLSFLKKKQTLSTTTPQPVETSPFPFLSERANKGV